MDENNMTMIDWCKYLGITPYEESTTEEDDVEGEYEYVGL